LVNLSYLSCCGTKIKEVPKILVNLSICTYYERKKEIIRT